MPGMTTLTRSPVIAHRVAVHGLAERVEHLEDVAVLDLGVQNSPPGSPDVDLGAGSALTLAWSIRGAPHMHRTATAVPPAGRAAAGSAEIVAAMGPAEVLRLGEVR